MHISRRNRQLYWHIHIYRFLAKCTFTLQGKVPGKDVIRIRCIDRANKFITCLQNISLYILSCCTKPMEFNATECILIHRRNFISISQQRTICTSTYKQYEDFDLMYLIKWGIDE